MAQPDAHDRQLCCSVIVFFSASKPSRWFIEALVGAQQVDIQHAPTDYQLLGSMLTAVNAAGKPAVVRVEGPHDRGGIQQVGRKEQAARSAYRGCGGRSVTKPDHQLLAPLPACCASPCSHCCCLLAALLPAHSAAPRGSSFCCWQALDLGAAGIMVPTVNTREGAGCPCRRCPACLPVATCMPVFLFALPAC